MSEISEENREGRRKALRKRIEKSIEAAKEERRRELLRRRIETARQGLRAFEERRFADSVRSFVTYIKILEDWKGVPAGGLKPANFDSKKDLAELLLINSVYWHLVKLYDHMKGASGREFTLYLEKYVLFTKGMPFAPLASETLRKYLRTRGVAHRKEMKDAYKLMTGAKCFVATSLIDLGAEETVPALRDYRDEVLLRSWSGRAFVRVYYFAGPALAWTLDRAPASVRTAVSQTLDQLAIRLSRR